MHRIHCRAEPAKVRVVPPVVPPCADHRPMLHGRPGVRVRGQPAVPSRQNGRERNPQHSATALRGLHAVRGARSHWKVHRYSGNVRKGRRELVHQVWVYFIALQVDIARIGINCILRVYLQMVTWVAMETPRRRTWSKSIVWSGNADTDPSAREWRWNSECKSTDETNVCWYGVGNSNVLLFGNKDESELWNNQAVFIKITRRLFYFKIV